MKKLFRIFFVILLFSPLLGYIYTEILGLPKTILHFYTLTIFVIGFFSVFFMKIHVFPRFLWLLLFYAFYRFFWQQIIPRENVLLTHIYYSVQNFSIVFILLAVFNSHFTQRFIKNAITIFKVTVIIAAIVSIVQVFNTNLFNAFSSQVSEGDYNLYTFRRLSIFGFVDLNEIGLSFLPLSSVLIGYMLYTKQKTYIYYLLLIGIISILSNGRYIMVGFVILSLQFFVFKKISIRAFFRYIIIAFSIGLLLYFLLRKFGYNIYEWYNERLLAEGSIEETTRFKALETFAKFFPKNPIFGTGVHLTEEIRKASMGVGSSQIHVGYLSHLVSYGIVGSVMLFSFWFFLARRLYRNAKRTNYWGSFFAFLIFFWAQATLVNYSIFFTGLIFALIFDKYLRDQYLRDYINKHNLDAQQSDQKYY
jgi:hypothetical protein